jgi:hypothetical protein
MQRKLADYGERGKVGKGLDFPGAARNIFSETRLRWMGSCRSVLGAYMRNLRFWMLALLAAPLLSACWASKTALMPEEAKDDIPLVGDYRSATPSGDGAFLKRLNSRQFELTEVKAGRSEKIGVQSYDRIAALPPTDGIVGGGFYIVEHHFEGQGDGYPFAYTLARISIADGGSVYFDLYLVKCPPGRPKVKMLGIEPCRFQTYQDVQAEALKTIDWINTARAAVYTMDFRKAGIEGEAAEAKED